MAKEGRHLTVRIDGELQERLELTEEALETQVGVSINTSDIVRNALDDHLRSVEELEEAIEDLESEE